LCLCACIIRGLEEDSTGNLVLPMADIHHNKGNTKKIE